MRYRILSLAALAAALAAPAHSMQPGLWQIDSKLAAAEPATQQTLGLLLQQLGNLPPEQRGALEQMAARNGVTLPTVGADGAIAARACLTAQMLERRQIPTGQPGDCSSRNADVAGGMTLSFVCSNPPSSGEGTLRYRGERDFSMQMRVTTSARGAPEQVTVDSVGKWLGAACPAAPR
ncbi:DUF3617 domain-containing protein [Janthinobacterium sp.]|uniref:DUF3617 domain-containing protein n=1 Tax=Janthinobacterium sp. TaxID=1871054 RepID=UPI00293D86D1|nr:DUF3617 domain-containing protein [Janthinobacterium sp.]